ncbi:hypothetical protein GJ744_001395 [Endocarpon pusillum]|uniref:Uncharacterized protein n=1 Tax=Endocarpon pusillum TaxID=364733 RepID=A0A8H7ANG2_9EURO|nr:hypothetical protein GJ744_001395 [Endocarpon pusillum]
MAKRPATEKQKQELFKKSSWQRRLYDSSQTSDKESFRATFPRRSFVQGLRGEPIPTREERETLEDVETYGTPLIFGIKEHTDKEMAANSRVPQDQPAPIDPATRTLASFVFIFDIEESTCSPPTAERPVPQLRQPDNPVSLHRQATGRQTCRDTHIQFPLSYHSLSHRHGLPIPPPGYIRTSRRPFHLPAKAMEHNNEWHDNQIPRGKILVVPLVR